MTKTEGLDSSSGFPLFQGVLPIKAAQIPAEIVAELTLASLAIPELIRILGTSLVFVLPLGILLLLGSASDRNQCWFRHSCISRPLKDSTNALSIGFYECSNKLHRVQFLGVVGDITKRKDSLK